LSGWQGIANENFRISIILSSFVPGKNVPWKPWNPPALTSGDIIPANPKPPPQIDELTETGSLILCQTHKEFASLPGTVVKGIL
jgi:hypothetical protein